VSYPKEWVEVPLAPATNFGVGVERPDVAPGVYGPVLRIFVRGTPAPLEDAGKIFISSMLQYGTDFKILSDKPSRLKDGTPVREVEFEFVPKYDPNVGSLKDRPTLSFFAVMAKRELALVNVHLYDDKKIGEDLKTIAYSLTFLQGREEPVSVPPDVRAFLNMYCADLGSHEVGTLIAHFSDRFLYSSVNKGLLEQYWRNDPTSPLHLDTISCEPTVTVFESRGDKAYVDGFFLVKAKGDANALKLPMEFMQIVNEHGQWKWYGNHK
jgi:hypothetical protein